MKLVLPFVFLLLLTEPSIGQTNTFPLSGNVGIGTTNPGGPLHVNSTAAKIAYFETSNMNGGYIALRESGVDKFYIGNSAVVSGVGVSGYDIWSPGALNFFTGSSSVTKVVINASGNLGIGTTTPRYPFHVVSAPILGNSQVVLESNSAGNTSYAGIEGLSTTGRGFYLNIADIGCSSSYLTHAGDVTLAATANAKLHLRAGATDASGITIDVSGNVGISRTTSAKFTIGTPNVTILGSVASSGLQIDANDNNKVVGNLSQIGLGLINAYTPVAIAGVITDASAYSTMDLLFATRPLTSDIAPIERMRITSSGNIGIGTMSPSEKLCVNGNIKTQKLIVTQQGWSDYVFDSSYQLRSLPKVEQFIKEHKHLPEIPSAKEIEKNGIEMGETAALLLKKIEELTLYMIDIKKENRQLKEEVRMIKREIEKKK